MSPALSTPSNIGNATDPFEIVVGWISSGRDRGTIDILWDSCFTIVICTWVSVYPNIPSPRAKWYHRLLEKVWMALVGLLGPDLLFGIALGQLSAAKRSVKIFRDNPELCGGMKWTYAHGFFLNMGGIHLTSPDYPDGFPINAEQLSYLVKHKHVDFPDMAKMDISERNTQDTLSRMIAVWQVFWFFVAQMIRVRDGLPMTALELTALTFALVMVSTSICWFYKPSITHPRYIPTRDNATVESIRQYAKRNTHTELPDEWYRTPIDFISRRPFAVDKHWWYCQRLSQIIRFPLVNRHITPCPVAGPWDRYPSDEFVPVCLDVPTITFAGITLIGFSASLLFSWDFYFETVLERTMWRAITIYQSSFTILTGVWYLWETIKWHRNRRNETPLNQGRPASTVFETDLQAVSDEETQCSKRPTRGILTRVRESLRSWRNISVDQDPTEALPVHINLPIIVVTFIYILCRFWMYTEDFMSLRSQPRGVYTTVNRYIPFLG